MRPRVIPIVLINDGYVIKTKAFRKPKYVGDPINTVKLFNEKGADELVLLDIGLSRSKKAIDFGFVEDIVSEAFMPVTYGGGIRTVEDARRLMTLGLEKVALNTALTQRASLAESIVAEYGSQAVVASIDVEASRFRGQQSVRGLGANGTQSAAEWAAILEARGVGEIILSSVPREGTRNGYDLELISSVSRAVTIPVVANGGSGTLDHFRQAVEAGASAVAAGRMFCFRGDRDAVLISYPSDRDLEAAFKGVVP